jgi:hypothetical protein
MPVEEEEDDEEEEEDDVQELERAYQNSVETPSLLNHYRIISSFAVYWYNREGDQDFYAEAGLEILRRDLPAKEKSTALCLLIRKKLNVRCVFKSVTFMNAAPLPYNLYLLSVKKDAKGNLYSQSFVKKILAAQSFLFEQFADAAEGKSSYLIAREKRLRSSLNKAITNKNRDEGVTKGKSHFPFELYTRLCKHYMRSSHKHAVFMLCYLTWLWNVMCRSNNLQHQKFNDIQMDGDAMTIQFRKTKGKQQGGEGSGGLEPIRVYALPDEPDLCAFLSMSLYKHLCGFSENQVFIGAAADTFFNKQFKKTMAIEPFVSLLQDRDLNPNAIGSHSVRKSTTSHATNGTTDGPSLATVALRADWDLGEVLKAYIKRCKAGDANLGRIAAGHDNHSEHFDRLPPFVTVTEQGDKERMNGYVRLFYPDIPATSYLLGQFMTASLIYHLPHLRSTIPLDSRLRLKSLFLLGDEEVAWIRSFISTTPSATMKPTGITPLTTVLKRMCGLEAGQSSLEAGQSRLEEGMSLLTESVNALHPAVLQNGVPNITHPQTAPQHVGWLEDLSSLVVDKLLERNLASLVADKMLERNIHLDQINQQQPAQVTAAFQPVAPAQVAANASYVWDDGSVHPLPKHSKVPMQYDSALFLWFRGSQETGLSFPPLSLVEPKHSPHKAVFQEYASTMKKICHAANLLGILPNNTVQISTEQVNIVLNGVLDHWGVTHQTLLGGDRSVPRLQLSWKTGNKERSARATRLKLLEDADQ